MYPASIFVDMGSGQNGSNLAWSHSVQFLFVLTMFMKL